MRKNQKLALVLFAALTLCGFASARLEGEGDLHEKYYDNIENLMVKSGPKYALNGLNYLYSANVVSSDNCHLMAHLLGGKAAELFGLNKALSNGSHTCRSGYFHGVLEHIVNEKQFSNDQIVQLCSAKEIAKEGDRLQCLHGVGHGLTEAEDYNIDLALNICSGFSNETERKTCAGGAYMEALKPGHMGQSPADENYSSVFDFCKRKFEDVCSLYSGYSLIRRNSGNYGASLKQCENSPEKNYCYFGFGAILARSLDFKPAKVYQHCKTSSFGQTCFLGAASEYGLSQEFEKGIAFCKPEFNFTGLICISKVLGGISKYI